MYKFKKIVFAIQNRLLRILFPQKAWGEGIKWTMAHYDMVKEEDELFFSQLYLYFIKHYIQETFGDNKIKILDVGCGQGRIAIPLAKMGYDVDAVDFSKEVILKGKEYAEDKGVNINFNIDDISNFLDKKQEGFYDCVVCTEVIYMLSNYSDSIRNLIRVLRMDGLLILSARPKLFYVLHQLMNNKLERAFIVSSRQNGHSISWFFNWFTKEELIEELTALGISNIECYGIGVASGIEGDPQGAFSRPSLLSDEQREKLYEIELNLAPIYPDSGRYILAIGKKVR